MSINNDCPICYELLNVQTNYVVTECGHAFHCSCLMKHTSINGFHCPYCRNQTSDHKHNDDEDDEDEDETIMSEDTDTTEYEFSESYNVDYHLQYITENCGPNKCPVCIELRDSQTIINIRSPNYQSKTNCVYCLILKEKTSLCAFRQFTKLINNKYNQEEEEEDEEEEEIIGRIPTFEEYKNFIINQLGYTLDDFLKMSLIDYFDHFTTLRLENIPESIKNTNYTLDILFENIDEYTENYNNNG